jgi:NADP-dependent 3-hydroxy acid dehydrogenase YdfG
MTEEKPLAGKVAVVTGASRGAGRAIAAVLEEIDEIALATFRSITIATMLGIMDRRVVPATGRKR